MGQLHIKNNLIQQAEQIIQAKQTIDDISAALDTLKIENTISSLSHNAVGSVEVAQSLHEELMQKYATIVALQNAVSAIENIRKKIPSPFKKQISPTPLNVQYIEILKFDRFGVWADVLLKHRFVSTVEDIIERVDVDEV